MADFKAIETFLWVVTLGSFRGAAQKLNTTQPAISQRIAQLEREMGVQLLQRDRRAIAPTPAGRRLMLYAEKLIGLRSEMLASVGDRSEMRGVLRLGVAETIVHTWLSQLIKSVNHAYPNLTLEIEVDITSNLRARLLAQEIELALLMGPRMGGPWMLGPLPTHYWGWAALLLSWTLFVVVILRRTRHHKRRMAE